MIIFIDCKDHTLVQQKANEDNFLMFVRQYRICFLRRTKGRFPLIAEITRCHTFTKEINHASARCQF